MMNAPGSLMAIQKYVATVFGQACRHLLRSRVPPSTGNSAKHHESASRR